jgi:hypothetical protein
MEYVAVPTDQEPNGVPWPWLRGRDERHEVIAVYQVWYMAMTHEPSGFRLERRWHPDMGEEREWVATSRDGDFGMLGQARGLFRHPGRKPALRGPEQIRAVRQRLTRAAAKPPTTARLASALGISTDTLRDYEARWGVNDSTEKV